MINNKYYFEMNELANECRREWFISENVPIDIFSVVMNKIEDISIIFMDMGDISGASTIAGDSKLIFINSTQSYGRQRFNLAHELYHMLYENKSFTCNDKYDKKNENKADQFASCLLMPHGALSYYQKINKIEKWTIEDIVNAEQFFQVSHHAFICRLRRLEKISYDDYLKYKKSVKNKAKKLGYSLKLYEPYHDKEITIGSYVRKVNELSEKDRISLGLHDELLADAFCFESMW